MTHFYSNLLKAIVFLQFVFQFHVQAQEPDVKFGKVAEEDLKMTVYSNDSIANAVILYDYGQTEFRYDAVGDDGWQLHFKRTIRIKILNEEGVSAGDFHFSLYHDGSAQKEDLTGIDGFTFNYENGKITKTKLERKNIMEKEEDKNHTAYSFAMPNVHKGSVIDVTYTIVSDFLFNLQPWRFQYSIPVKWSEYNVCIPEYFNYKHILLGYNHLAINEITNGTGSVTFKYSTRSGYYTVSTTFENETVKYSTSCYRLAMENVPAFEEEAYLSSPENYLSTYSFELLSVKDSYGIYTEFTNTWDKINELLLEDESFGKAVKRKGFLEDAVTAAINGYSLDIDKTKAVLDLIRQKVRWNKINSLYAEDIKKAWQEGSGNSGDINLMLVSALNSAGVLAEPVAISTRSNGILNPIFPSVTDFNYVIACVLTGSDTLLMDATEQYAPCGLLPERCLNGRGRIISEKYSGWVSLKPKAASSQSGNYDYVMNTDGSVHAVAKQLHEGYNALDFRKEVNYASSVDDFYNEKEKNTAGLNYTIREIHNLDDLSLPVEENLTFTLTDPVDVSGELILINPMLFTATKINPFKLKERLYPVEFPWPISETILIKWILPEGYSIDQLPAPTIVTLQNKGGKFTYNVVQNENTVLLTSIIKINQTLFMPDEYGFLKEFFNLIISKQVEQIVVKKM